MSTTYMVKSSLVFLACHINVVLMTILFIFGMSKSTEQRSMLYTIQTMIYMLGVIFNVYVVLYASRKWELIAKYFKFSREYVSMMQEEIKLILINSATTSMLHAYTAMNDIREAWRQIYSKTWEVACSEPVIESKPLINKESNEDFGKDSMFIYKRQLISEEKTPELKPIGNLKIINRPKSDPIRKTVRQEFMKAPSPELMKNKIFRSRMNLTCDSRCSRMDADK